MRTKDSKLMEKISAFVGDYYCNYHISPSLNTIAKALFIGKTTAYEYILAMNDKGMLSYDSGEIQNSKIKKCKSRYLSVPVVSSIKCSEPEMHEEQVDEYVSLPESVFGNENSYLLRISDDSMTDAYITEGDIVLIQKNCQVKKGDLVVASDNRNENTLKRYVGYDKKNQNYILKYENEEKYPGKIIKLKKLNVHGVVRKIIKDI